jgi:hypothetical protein
MLYLQKLSNQICASQGLFVNPWSTWTEKGFSDVFKWMRESRKLKAASSGFLESAAYPTKVCVMKHAHSSKRSSTTAAGDNTACATSIYQIL